MRGVAERERRPAARAGCESWQSAARSYAGCVVRRPRARQRRRAVRAVCCGQGCWRVLGGGGGCRVEALPTSAGRTKSGTPWNGRWQAVHPGDHRFQALPTAAGKVKVMISCAAWSWASGSTRASTSSSMSKSLSKTCTTSSKPSSTPCTTRQPGTSRPRIHAPRPELPTASLGPWSRGRLESGGSEQWWDPQL